MILLCCWERLMIKRPTIAACNGRFRKRKNSAIRTLVAETLVLAKTHGYVEKIESELEAELARDISDPPEDKILRWRRKGDTIFKSKHVLLTVVILCVVDCALVLGELALDLYKVKATLAKTDDLTRATHAFVSKMADLHPNLNQDSPSDLFNVLLNSEFIWTDDANNTHLERLPTLYRCSNTTMAVYDKENSAHTKGQGHVNDNITLTLPDITNSDHGHDEHYTDVVGQIAHIFHYLSIAILLIIMIETILKAICAGRAFFHRKIEVFDASIVLLSFFVDFCFLAFLPDIDTKDFVFILAILLPWRVIRVVNSLVVSVKDHEHFRLKLVYKRKKKIQGNLRDTEAMLQKYMSQVTTLQRLCIMEGIEEWKVDNYLKSEEQTQPVTPSKRKFKFKFDDSGMQGHNRTSRCSMPTLDFHGLRLPSSVHVSRSRISLPAVANSIKNTLSKTFPSRRASLAAVEALSTKMSNGDVRKKKVTSEDLGTMEEEDLDDLDNHDSALSSRATSESGDVFSRLSVSDSIGSDRIFTEAVIKNGTKRRDSVQTVDEKDEQDRMVKMKDQAKRRHSESNLDKQRVNMAGLTEGVSFKIQSGKTYTKPQHETSYKTAELEPELHSVDKCDDATATECNMEMQEKDSSKEELMKGSEEKVIKTGEKEANKIDEKEVVTISEKGENKKSEKEVNTICEKEFNQTGEREVTKTSKEERIKSQETKAEPVSSEPVEEKLKTTDEAVISDSVVVEIEKGEKLPDEDTTRNKPESTEAVIEIKDG